MRFLYFIPGVCPSELSALPDLHPKRVLEGCEVTIRGTNDGPSGEPGCVVMANEPDDAESPTVCGYYPERQEWKQYPGWSLGWDKGKLPGPADLIREDAVGGDPLKLGDGNEWLLPLLGPAWQELPGAIQDKPEGGCEVVMLEKFNPLCKESEWWFDIVQQKAAYSFDRLFTFVSDALAANYHVGRPEVGALKLLATDSMQHVTILIMLLGMARVVRESKKNSPVGG
jgi:hypothetical protein